MKKRMEGIDIARAFAILGMMFVNYSKVFQVESVSRVAHFFVGLEGRAAAVFMVVAGIGVGLLCKRGVDKKLYGQLIKRSLYLWVLGLILFTVFEWTADILHYYGLFMLLILPFLNAGKKAIGLGIALTLIVSTVLQLSQNYLMGWDFTNLKYVDFWTLEGFFRNLTFNGFHPLFPWFSFMLIGLLLSKMPLGESNYQKKLMIFGLGLALVAEALSIVLSEFVLKGHWLIDFVQTKPMPPNLLYIAASTGWAIAFISFCIWAAEALSDKRALLDPLIFTGQMSLTHYVGHSAIVLSILDGFGMIKPQSAVCVFVLTIDVYTMMMLFSVLWRGHFERGPMELIMRQISDREKKNA